jgi:hypothetical protein
MATINLGKIKPLWRGDYTAGATYRPLDFVNYNNETYINILESTGNLPTNETYFEKVVQPDNIVHAPNSGLPNELSVAANSVYGKSNILGTVSQSSGVPTGAIIQRGSNANGEFVRFADGTQILYKNLDFGIADIANGSFSDFFSALPLPINLTPAQFEAGSFSAKLVLKTASAGWIQIGEEQIQYRATSNFVDNLSIRVKVIARQFSFHTISSARLNFTWVGRWYQ